MDDCGNLGRFTSSVSISRTVLPRQGIRQILDNSHHWIGHIISYTVHADHVLGECVVPVDRHPSTVTPQDYESDSSQEKKQEHRTDVSGCDTGVSGLQYAIRNSMDFSKQLLLHPVSDAALFLPIVPV